MSACLVGSEMGMKDRPNATPPHTHLARLQACTVERHRRCDEVPELIVAAVRVRVRARVRVRVRVGVRAQSRVC